MLKNTKRGIEVNPKYDDETWDKVFNRFKSK